MKNKTIILTIILEAIFFLKSSLAVASSNFDKDEGKIEARNIQVLERGKNQKFRTIVENGGVFPRKTTQNVRYGIDSLVVEIPSRIKGIQGGNYIKNRSEIHIVSPVRLQDNHWIQFSVFFPRSFLSPDNWFIIFQAWQKYAGNPILAVSINKYEQFEIGIRNDFYHKGSPFIVYLDSKKIIKGLWYDFVIHLKGSLRGEATLEVWRREGSKTGCFTKLIDITGISIGKSVYRDGRIIKSSDQFISPRVGIYRGKSSFFHQLWFDGLKYGGKQGIKKIKVCR